ncbi:MAG: OadG family protein [Candidatus Delongbacteria bacterium]|nr:OadG family protein [Candidatus Delongbacteria bacterium]
MQTQLILNSALICLIGMLIVFIGLYLLIVSTGLMKRCFYHHPQSRQNNEPLPILSSPVSEIQPSVSSGPSGGPDPEIIAAISAVLCLNQPAATSLSPLSASLSVENWVSSQRYSAMTAYRKK